MSEAPAGPAGPRGLHSESSKVLNPCAMRCGLLGTPRQLHLCASCYKDYRERHAPSDSPGSSHTCSGSSASSDLKEFVEEDWELVSSASSAAYRAKMAKEEREAKKVRAEEEKRAKALKESKEDEWHGWILIFEKDPQKKEVRILNPPPPLPHVLPFPLFPQESVAGELDSPGSLVSSPPHFLEESSPSGSVGDQKKKNRHSLSCFLSGSSECSLSECLTTASGCRCGLTESHSFWGSSSTLSAAGTDCRGPPGPSPPLSDAPTHLQTDRSPSTCQQGTHPLALPVAEPTACYFSMRKLDPDTVRGVLPSAQWAQRKCAAEKGGRLLRMDSEQSAETGRDGIEGTDPDPECTEGREKGSSSACAFCLRKAGIHRFDCRCGRTFCSKHRLPEAHECSFDFKAFHEKLLRERNQKVTKDQLEERV
uniref:AN1-type domain-containing protein n=1 Tax=Chromera velia CCMP2878 TaxID=1169474 RepID=A0A0G4I3D4_9ALVE|mmetsp:Transcript_15624/g.31686  ORF Transcript_15624/g.31686 Transcript_15624/m.31686 type:complete len:423 (+) Transcript_15624:225-1493(+)|eukprot:Cvel_10650.t1-p1 / transcript=Cvel_10650.t1 / gene=Cvel_10650 / organism=Chromera_velia_CCMP2878 / gene_product=Zinc finger A20 and AN1 domain-containing, putative / transcript_product=Zinc finger A20 and AN1 domain-containing, putative / location=Cvel_scaffold647:31047-32709(+) / protein_length=422 / sequence_SO=supercontig / SO=protein_coding / is_pseudo=false